MKLNILSDLHLGQGDLDAPCNDADGVILAGDIAHPAEALAWAQALGKPVLYVPGNHEYYGGSIVGVDAQWQALTAGTQVQVLQQGERVVAGVRFLGATLWTDFRLFPDRQRSAECQALAQRLLRDFSRIALEDGVPDLLTPAHCTALFDRHAAWLEQKLAQPHGGPTVVITHHAPSPRSIHPRFAQSLLNACFVSNAEHLLDGRRVQLWVHGHVHDSFDYCVNGTRVVCNPRGYALGGTNENALFDPNFMVEIG